MAPVDLTHVLVLIVWKGGSSRIHISGSTAAGIIVGVGAAVALLVTAFFLPWLYRRLIKDDWELKYYHLPLGPLLLYRKDVPPPPPDHKPVQDYYRGHLTMEQLLAQRAAQNGNIHDVEKANGNGIGGDSSKALTEGSQHNDDEIHSESSDLGNHPKAKVTAPEPAPTKSSIIGPRPDGDNFSLPVLFWQFKRAFFHGIEKDIIGLQNRRNILTGDIETVHAHASHYDNRAEYMYSFLQAMTAATASFTHGANDVSKYVGPPLMCF